MTYSRTGMQIVYDQAYANNRPTVTILTTELGGLLDEIRDLENAKELLKDWYVRPYLESVRDESSD